MGKTQTPYSVKGALTFPFLLFFLSLQAQTADSLLLEEAQVVDYHIDAGQTFKQTLILADSLNRAGRYSLAETLRDHSGIFVRSYGGNGIATLSFRGTGAAHTHLYWNNLKLGSPMLGLADLSLIPTEAFDELKIQYGFSSLSDGSGAVGGSLRLRNRPDFGAKNYVQVRQSIGSFGRFQTVLSGEAGNRRFRSQTRLYWHEARNDYPYPDVSQAGTPYRRLKNSEFQQRGIMQNFHYRPDSRQLLSLNAWLGETLRKLPPPITGNADNYDQLKDYSLALGLSFQQSGPKYLLLVNSGISRADNIFYQNSQPPANNEFISWQNNARLQYNFSEKSSAEFGLSYFLEEAASPSYERSPLRHHSSLFGKWDYRASSSLLFSLLLREELINDDFSPLLGSAGFNWEFRKGSQLKANVARNFRFPTLNDLYWVPGGNSDLKPEKSWNFELGLRQEILPSPQASPSLLAEITFFHNLVDDWIQWLPVANYTSPENYKMVANTGLETELKGKYSPGDLQIDYRLSYAYTRSTTTAVYGGGEGAGQLPFIPFHKLSAGISLAYKNYSLRYSQNYTSYYFSSATNDIYMPPFSVAEVNLLYSDLLRNQEHLLDLSFGIHNLYDFPYQVLPWRPEAGISINLQLTYRIGV